jgi:demethylmenaquinone methyltransferase/2-methoxy-6-polyprenyl-1,4-benzoquinol methylase
MKGTTPAGTATEREASAWVRAMFGRVAHRYDLANHLLSFNIDRHWRAATVHRARSVLNRPGARVLDLCCGTGDLLLALERGGTSPVLGADFCHPMLVAAGKKGARALMEADALMLPLRDASIDLVTVAFGFRNLANYEHGLMEMRRILKPGGLAAILEFSQPTSPVFAALYGFYSRRILPVLGGAISGAKEAYTYLPESVRKFPTGEQLADDMRRAGFRDVSFTHMTGGIVALHTGSV